MTHVTVLAGGLCPERDVSIRSGRRVAEALRSAGFEVDVRDTDAELLPLWEVAPPDVIVPLLHGAVGEDGSLRDVLETLGLPYVGSRPAGCRMAFDKPIAKATVGHAGAVTPDWLALPHSAFRELGAQRIMTAALARLGLPLVVKPTRGGSALGLTIVESADDLPAAMVAGFAYCPTVLLEAFVPGVEVAVSVIDTDDGPQALPAVELRSDSGVYDYQARYTAGLTEFFAPARISHAAASAASSLALTAHAALGLRDFSRTDMIITDEEVPVFLETNVAPGMTETSLMPQSIAAADLTLSSVMADLVVRAAARSR